MTPQQPLYVAYDKYVEAKVWQEFAAAALGGLLARGVIDDVAAENAALTADALVAEFRKRFHHDRPE